ncbi:unnamed protein product, partial [Owenia fusiformis]
GTDSCGIHLHQRSTLLATYTNIRRCQLTIDQYQTALVLRHVAITESPGIGLSILRMRHPINITDSNFVNNTLSGINVETYTGQVNIERVEASDNGDTGATYIRLPEPSPQRKMMFCTPGVETTELSAGEAVEVIIDTTHTDMRSGCIQVNHILMFHPMLTENPPLSRE